MAAMAAVAAAAAVSGERSPADDDADEHRRR
jgi:hypothetical protein